MIGGVFIISNKSSPAQPETSAQTSPSPSTQSKTVVQTQQQETTSTQTPTEKKTSPKSSSESKPRVIPGKITAYVTDQYGNAYGGKDSSPNSRVVEIVDALGERASWATIEDGQLESEESLPAGHYTIGQYTIKDSLHSSLNLEQTPVIKTFTLPPEGIDLGTLIINRWGSVKFRLVNEVGTILRNDTQQFLTKCEITDEFIKTGNVKNAPATCAQLTGSAFGVMSVYSQDDYVILGYYPAGNYTFKIKHSGYEGVEKSFSINNRDVDLGTIVLKKK